MKTRNLVKLFSVAFIALILFQSGYSLPTDSSGNKTIVVLGSSVAAGWVTSYKEKYDMQNGYAARLGRLIESSGWTVKNISIPGFDTKNTIARFEKDVLPLNPRSVFIGLSLANEGLTTENPDSVFARYHDGITKLIDLCRKHNMVPVVGLCYSNNDYSNTQYEYLKRMNLLISSWDVPCINLLGAIDDGSGHFPERYTFDTGHPDDRGHEELFYAFVPDLFDALIQKKNFSKPPVNGEKFITLGKQGNFQQISYVPGEVMHPFTMGFSFRTSGDGLLGEIITSGAVASRILVNNEGNLVYQSKENLIVSNLKPEKNKWHQIMITHGYLVQKTTLYLDGVFQCSCEEQIEPTGFIIGNGQEKSDYRDLRIFRSALNHDEVRVISEGNSLTGSLEVMAPLDDQKLKKGMSLSNYAQSLGAAILDPADINIRTAALEEKIARAAVVRANELKVEHKKAIPIDPAVLEQFTGQYEIAPGDYFLVEKKEGRLYFIDRGNSAELLPEATNKFFIRYPADLSVVFESDGKGHVTGLVFAMNGRKMKASKVLTNELEK